MALNNDKFTLISFSVENYRLFYDKVELSMASRKLKGRTFTVGTEEVLNYALIFGENASGKSSLIKALLAMWNCVRYSAEQTQVPKAQLTPNRFQIDAYTKPVRLSLSFGLGDRIFEYGFAYDASHNSFVEEYLHEDQPTSDNPIIHFEYSTDSRSLSLAKEHENKRDIYDTKKRSDALFLSMAYLFTADKTELLSRIYERIRDDIFIVAGVNPGLFPKMAARIAKDQKLKSRLVELLRLADFSILDLIEEKIPFHQLPPQVIQQIVALEGKVPETINTLSVSHRAYSNGEEQGTISLNIADESDGTQRFIEFIESYIDALENGKVVVIDEFDASLHPRLTKLIVQLFQDYNETNAQLIATTHDTSLLNMDGLTKYHIYITQKTKTGSAELYSLADFKDLRITKRFEKNYLDGVFGGVPQTRLTEVIHDDAEYGKES